MKNEYITTSDETAILIRRRNGDVSQVLISTSDLGRAQEFSGTWCLAETAKGRLYAYGKSYADNGKGQQGGGATIYMHRWLMGLDAGDKRQVDHAAWQTLDCRRNKMRVVTQQVNTAHRQLTARPNANNSTGIRNVSLSRGRYLVQVASRYVGTYDDLSTAARSAAKARVEFTTRKLQEAVADIAARKPMAVSKDYSTRMTSNAERFAAVVSGRNVAA